MGLDAEQFTVVMFSQFFFFYFLCANSQLTQERQSVSGRRT